MAKQTCILTYTGKLGNQIGIKTKSGHYVRSQPTKINQTTGTRRAAHRFGQASKVAALIRKAFHAAHPIPADSGHINRLTKALIPSAGKDLKSIIGFRFHNKVTCPKIGEAIKITIRIGQSLIIALQTGNFTQIIDIEPLLRVRASIPSLFAIPILSSNKIAFPHFIQRE